MCRRDRFVLVLALALLPVGGWLLLGGSGPLEPLVDSFSAASLLLLSATAGRLLLRRRPSTPPRLIVLPTHPSANDRAAALPAVRPYSTTLR